VILVHLIDLKTGVVRSLDLEEVDDSASDSNHAGKEGKASRKRGRRGNREETTHHGGKGPVRHGGHARCLSTGTEGKHFRTNNPNHWAPAKGETNDEEGRKAQDEPSNSFGLVQTGKNGIGHQRHAHDSSSQTQQLDTAVLVHGSDCDECGEKVNGVQGKGSSNRLALGKESIQDIGCVKHNGVDLYDCKRVSEKVSESVSKEERHQETKLHERNDITYTA
jgi:hypothetical protein